MDKTFKCTLSEEHTEYKWVDIDDLSKFKISPKLKKNIIFKELMGIIANIIAGMSDVGRSLSSSFNDELTSSDLVLLFDLYNIDTCNKRRYV